MPRFIAIHTLPVEENNFQAMVDKSIGGIPKGFTWKQTYCDFANHKFFCEWEAPSKEALEEGFKAQKLPFDAVYPVKLYTVAKKKFEP